MKPIHKILTVFTVPWLVLSLALLARAQTSIDIDAATRINAANDLVRAGKYDQALFSYGKVNPTASEQFELDYNRAVAQYRRGDIESARAAFEQASASSNSSLAAAARYNLGNCFYSDAVQVASKDPASAIAALQQAIHHYRSALVGDPNLVDARANIELANEWIKQLQQQQDQSNEGQQSNPEQQSKQDQQSNEDQQSSKDQKSSEEQKSDQEKQPSDSSEKNSESQQEQTGQDQQPSPESQPADSQEQQSSPDQSNSEQSPAEESQSGAESQDKPDQKQPSPEQAQPKQSQPNQSDSATPHDAADNQSSSDAELQPGEQPPAEKPPAEQKPVPTGQLTPADQSQDHQQPPAVGATGEFDAKATLMTKEEALKMLQAVRDRDMLRRLRQEQIERNQHVPTVRDW